MIQTSIRTLIVAALLLVPTTDASAMNCSMTSVIEVAFGAYDVFNSVPNDSMGSITYECTGVGPSDTIAINLSSGGAMSYFPRQLGQGTAHLDYNLYLDAACSTVWGDGMSGTGRYVQASPPDGSPTTLPIYGRIPGLQNVPVGTYADTVVVTVLF